MSYWEDASNERPGREEKARQLRRQGQCPHPGGTFGQREKYICPCVGGTFKAISGKESAFCVREKILSLANWREEEMEG